MNYGSNSGLDHDTFTYDPNTGRPTGYNIYVNSASYLATLTNNTNGTVKGLNITDGFYSADTQACTFTYDDLSRLLTQNCGTVWGAGYSYDAFSNISKSMISGSPGTAFQPTYSTTTNQFYNDSIRNAFLRHEWKPAFGWDLHLWLGLRWKLITVSGYTGTFDALDRRVEVGDGAALPSG